jgi:hypothetical protein
MNLACLTCGLSMRVTKGTIGIGVMIDQYICEFANKCKELSTPALARHLPCAFVHLSTWQRIPNVKREDW